MRSWREQVAAMVAAAVAAGALGALGCGTDSAPPGEDPPGEDPPIACETSYLTYGNFGEPFILDWCRGCHSSSVPAGMRQDAPIDVNFDDAGDLAQWSARIAARSTGAAPTMPPAGGPTAEERALLAEWLACGGR